MPKLFLKFNEAILKEIELDRPQLTIGRKEDNDLTIDNLAVSGHHARIVQEHGAYFIEDRDSTNGTFLNDKRIQRQQLRNGDQIRIGKHLLVYEGEETPAPAAPPPSKGVDLDKTMILDTQKQRELLQAKQPAGAAPKA
ncbi:MAG: FHA domain-containing protein, partial [Nitrospirae bacterium]|nr:FHA domain-containing protein [Nitrospirota bacterium]